MTTFVLVHGASHGSWCWDKVVPLLEAQGHQAFAVDLPGNTYGEFDIPAARVTLDSYASHVCKVLDDLDEPVVLVGHSLGGLTISQVAERRPGKVRSLVYLTALLLESGRAMRPVRTRGPEDVRDGLERESWAVSDDLSTVIFHEESLKPRFYNDCTEDDFVWAKSMLVPQPSGPLMDPVQTTEENFDRVPRVYIECLKDGALSIEYQREMQANVPCQRVITMDTGHSPFLSAPEQLAGHLASL
ncbi:MAG: alpha/beta fold hydrolase [Chloroflexi bacterium]|nr:alpha/beta fold hydrolase [Chloroflexota bacterium]MDA1271358.1 alpha/beta fold hydrolase [Chloroflexota bacterium]